MKTINNSMIYTVLFQKVQKIFHLRMMMFSILFLCLNVSLSHAQVTESEVIFDKVEQTPKFPGGNEQLSDFFISNIQYKNLAETGIHGIVYVQFIVTKHGAIKDIKVVRSVNALLNNEAIRVVNLMPKWIPGQLDGKFVNTRMVLPIHFKIANG